MKALTLAIGRWETLPVFSFREEAEMFMLVGMLGEAWQIRETDAGELVSVLYGPCAHVRSVAVDPLPSMRADEVDGLISLNRERFVSRLVNREM